MSDVAAIRAGARAKAPPWALVTRPVLIARVQLALLMLPLAVIPFFRLVDNDFWWHLKTGELIFERGLFDSDPYSWTAPGAHWVLHEWLSEALIYAVQTSLGYWANCLLFSAAAVAALLIPYNMARRSGAGTRGLLAVMVFAVAIIATFVTVRPQVFSWLLFVVFLDMLHRHSEGEPARLWLLPPLMAVWANTHLGFFFGFMLLGAWSAVSAWRFARGDHRALHAPLLTAGACAAAACLNPEGPALLLYPLRYLTDAGATHQYVSEWQSPSITSPFHAPIFIGVALLARTLVSKHRPGPFLLIVTVAVIVLGLQAVRNAPFVALLLPPVCGVAAPRAWHWADASADARVTMPLASAVGLCALTVVMSSALMLSWNSALSLGAPDSRNYPAGAADYVERNHPGTRMLNEYGWGGYLINELYPDVPVAIDGRTDFYGDRVLSDYYTMFRADQGWEALLSQYAPDVVLVSQMSPLAKQLRTNGEWRESYTGDRASVFERSGGAEHSGE